MDTVTDGTRVETKLSDNQGEEDSISGSSPEMLQRANEVLWIESTVQKYTNDSKT